MSIQQIKDSLAQYEQLEERLATANPVRQSAIRRHMSTIETRYGAHITELLERIDQLEKEAAQ